MINIPENLPQEILDKYNPVNNSFVVKDTVIQPIMFLPAGSVRGIVKDQLDNVINLCRLDSRDTMRG